MPEVSKREIQRFAVGALTPRSDDKLDIFNKRPVYPAHKRTNRLKRSRSTMLIICLMSRSRHVATYDPNQRSRSTRGFRAGSGYPPLNIHAAKSGRTAV